MKPSTPLQNTDIAQESRLSKDVWEISAVTSTSVVAHPARCPLVSAEGRAAMGYTAAWSPAGTPWIADDGAPGEGVGSLPVMAWVAPDVPRRDEPFVGGERQMLHGFLQYGRDSLLLRCADLTGEQLVLRSAAPSSLSLLGVVRHMTDVERTWLRRRMARQGVPLFYATSGSSDAAFDDTDPDRAERDIDRLRAEWQAADEAVVHVDLDIRCQSPTHGQMSLRWVYLHLVREYAGHCGQADIFRERIDGRIRW